MAPTNILFESTKVQEYVEEVKNTLDKSHRKYKRKMRNVIITGATSGIGKAFALLMLRKGNNVVLNGRSLTRMNRVIKEAKNLSGNFEVVLGDCFEQEVISNMIYACKIKFDGLPNLCLVNAGRGLPGTLATSDDSQWESLFNINVLAVLKQLKYFSACMMEDVSTETLFSKKKDIVVIGSSIGRNVSPFNPIYGATKSAVHSATEALRREVGPQGVRVSLIEPGIVRSGFQETAGYDAEWFKKYVEEIGPVLSPDDIAITVKFITDLPPHVHANNVMIRPTRQAYP